MTIHKKILAALMMLAVQPSVWAQEPPPELMPVDQPAPEEALPVANAMAAGETSTDGEGVEQAQTVETIPVQPPEEAAVTAEPERPASSSRLVEEIIVTAQKREERLQDVPISISAFSADALDARGIDSTKDLPLATPGLTITQQAGFQITYLRGIGTDGFFFADPSIAMYIDGIYFPFGHGAAQNFGAIERVEVLKGPQGTLFGRNAVGGAVSITTAAPDFSEVSGSVMSAYGTFNDFEERAHINVPLTDNFALSVSAQYNSEEPYREDGRVAGQPLPDEVTRGARVKIRWAPWDRLDVTVAGFRLRQDGIGSLFSPNSNPSLLARTVGIQAETGYGGAVDAPAYFTLTNTVAYGNIVLNTDWFDVKLLGSDQYIETSALYDFDGSEIPLAWFSVFKQYGDVQTGELQVISNSDSWGSDWLTWIGGAYYFKGLQVADKARFQVAGSVLTAINDLFDPLPDSVTGILSNLIPSGEIGILDASGGTGTVSKSAYAQATTHFTDWFALTLGARYQVEERSVVKAQGAVVLPDGTEIPYQPTPEGLSNTTRTFKPKASLEFRPWDGGLLYLSYQEASKAATYNIINFIPNIDNQLLPDLIEPEELSAYEAGIKASAFDGAMQFSTAAFYYKLRDNQVQFISLLAGGAVTFENAPGAEVRGLEFDATSFIFPDRIDGLVFTVAGCFLDTKYTDFPSAQGYDETTGVYQSNLNLEGDRMARAPKFSGTAGLSKTTSLGSGSLEVGGEYYYNSGYYLLSQNNPNFEQKSYGVLGARVSYLYDPWALRITVFGQNLLDKYYTYGSMGTDFGPLTTAAPPLTVGLRLNWDF